MGGTGREPAGVRGAVGARRRSSRRSGRATPIHAIGLTGQCPSVVPIDARDAAAARAHLSRQPGVAEAGGSRERFGDVELHTLTGHVPAAFHVAAKIMWMRAHEPEVFAATRLFVQPTDFVALALTGET